MFIPAMYFLRLLGAYVGPVAWIAFAGATAWFLAAIHHAPPDEADQSGAAGTDPAAM